MLLSELIFSEYKYKNNVLTYKCCSLFFQRTIDLLKIDIEGDEWHAIPQMIASGSLNDVRQISMETHFSAEHANRRDYWGHLEPHKQLSALRQLYDFGYRTFMRERNMWSHAMWHGIKGFITNVNEISMIKPR